MDKSKGTDFAQSKSPLVASDRVASSGDTEILKTEIMDHLKAPNESSKCGKIISSTPAPKRNSSQPKILSPDHGPPLPCMGGFRLQPRKNITNLTSYSPSRSSVSSRGRKRGAQTMVCTLDSPSVGFPRAESSTSDDKSSDRLRTMPLQNNESCAPISPTFVHHAMQSMSIRSPTPSTPSLLESSFQDKETSSPFIVFSPSLKLRPCPSQQRPRSESISSLDSSSKPPSSLETTPRKVPSYGSPRRKSNTKTHTSIISELPSTPHSYCHMSNNSHGPSTPSSNRTLPSPHNTPLPRSIRLTPRSRRRSEDTSNESSIFLSPNEKLDHGPSGKDSTPIFSFETGIESLDGGRQRTTTRSSSYVPSPFSCSRTSGGVRVETRSLLGEQDSTSTLDCIISAANARANVLNCDGSLSDDSSEPFVLANPSTLAQERNAMTMPALRPTRRRRMSPPPISILIDVPSQSIESKTTAQDTVDVVGGSICAKTPTLDSPNDNRMNDTISSHDGGKTISRRSISSHAKPIEEAKATNGMRGRIYASRLEPIESCCSLVGLGLTESSSAIMDSNMDPATPPTKLDVSADYSPDMTSSNCSVRISRSDADNVKKTICSMAIDHQQLSPTLTACKS